MYSSLLLTQTRGRPKAIEQWSSAENIFGQKCVCEWQLSMRSLKRRLALEETLSMAEQAQQEARAAASRERLGELQAVPGAGDVSEDTALGYWLTPLHSRKRAVDAILFISKNVQKYLVFFLLAGLLEVQSL